MNDLSITPVSGAIRASWSGWTGRVRVLRNGTGIFSGYDDPGAVQVYDGAGYDGGQSHLRWSSTGGDAVTATPAAVRYALDLAPSASDAYYAVYFYDDVAGTWSPGGIAGPVPPVPAASYDELDLKTVLVDRLRAALAARVASGDLVLPAGDAVEVRGAFPLEASELPMVSVHLDQDQDVHHLVGNVGNTPGSGEDVSAIYYRHTYAVIGWTTNPRERDGLRVAIKGSLMEMLPLFMELGVDEIGIGNADGEDHVAFDSPVYFTTHHLSGTVAGQLTGGAAPPISDVVYGGCSLQ